jgi:outer membrane protein assembly factor BamB
MLEIAWALPAHHRVDTLLVDGEDCFVVARYTRLVAVNTATGEERWSAPVQTRWGWLAVTPTRVFYLNQHSFLQAHDRATGHLLWSRELRGNEKAWSLSDVYGWLHALEDRVIVGGWRGYTDILALHAADGRDCWSYPARGTWLHSTRVHATSASLVLAAPEGGGTLVFLSVATGQAVARVPVDNSHWRNTMADRPVGTRRPDQSLVVESGNRALFVVEGRDPTVERLVMPTASWSENLSCAGTVVPFLTYGGDLVAWSLPERRLLTFGTVKHNVQNLLPFCQVGPAAVVVGTQFHRTGHLGVFTQPGAPPVWYPVGKGVSTPLESSAGLIVFGTRSGQVLGMQVHPDG